MGTAQQQGFGYCIICSAKQQRVGLAMAGQQLGQLGLGQQQMAQGDINQLNGNQVVFKDNLLSQHLMHKDNLHYNNNMNLIKELNS